MRTVAIDRFISKPVKNFLFLIVGNGIRWVLSFFVTVYLARVLGASGFGKISFAFSIFAYGVLLSDLGLSILGTREVARSKEGIDELTSKILSLRFILAIFSFLILLIFSVIVPLENDIKVLIVLYSFSIFFYAFYLDWLYRGMERMVQIAISSILVQSVYVILVFTFIKNQEHILKIPFLWFTGIGVGAIFLLAIFLLRKHHLRFVIDFTLLKISIPIGIAAIMNQVYFHFDLVTIGLIKGATSVGLYNAGFKLVTFLLTIDTAFAWVYLPMVSRLFSESKEKFKKLVFTGAKLISIIVIPLAFGGTVLGARVIELLYGGKFIGASPAFRILIWAVPLTSIQSIFAFGLLGCNKEKQYSYGMIIGTTINVILNLVLIPYFGIKGASSATIISEVVMLGLMFLWFKKVLFVPFYYYFLKPLAATLVMLIVIILLWKLPTLYLIVACIFVYSLAILLVKGITEEDLKLLKGRYDFIHRTH